MCWCVDMVSLLNRVIECEIIDSVRIRAGSNGSVSSATTTVKIWANPGLFLFIFILFTTQLKI